MARVYRSRTKEEQKEDSKFYHVLEGDISEIRERLKVMYMANKDRSEDYIHGMIVRLDRIKSSLFTYVMDGHSANVALEERNGEGKIESKPNP